MMQKNNNRQLVGFFFILFIFCYQSVATILAIGFYFIAIKLLRLNWYWLATFGLISLAIASMVLLNHYPTLTIKKAILNGFILNFDFWKIAIESGYSTAIKFLWLIGKVYLLGLPLSIAGCFSLIQLIPVSAHERLLKSVSHAKRDDKKEIGSQLLDKLFKKVPNLHLEGTFLGISKWGGNTVIVPDKYLNQMLLVLGTTGTGKTITLQRFYQRALTVGYPLIIVDGKPTDESVIWVQEQAKENNRPFYGFYCGNHQHYNALAQGGHTELKDKVMTLKDEWDNDHYKTIAEDFLQTIFEVLIAQNIPFDLSRVVQCLNIDELIAMVRTGGSEELKRRVKQLCEYDKKDITGLQAHLNVLLNSEMGHYLKTDSTTFSLEQVIQSGGVAYFSLPALRFPILAKAFGKLIINDIKTVVDRKKGNIPLFLSFDEFSVFAGEQVLNIVNMGRAKGVHALFGTQGVPDLNIVSSDFADQLLNCVNTLICHRLNDSTSVEAVTTWAGTRDSFAVTAQVDTKEGGGGAGSVRRTKEYVVHPDDIKQSLLTGEAFFMTKIDSFKADKVKVKYS